MSHTSIVVPVYFNEESLPKLYEKFRAIANERKDDSFEFIFVDDGSGDDSFKILQKLAAEDRRVIVARLSRNFGSNAAILAGLMLAKGDVVAVISADLQDPPEMIPSMLDEWKAGTEVVVAARKSRQDPLLTRMLSAVTNRMLRSWVFPDYPPDGFDFIVIDGRVRDLLVDMHEMNSYVFGQVLWVGFSRKVMFYDRQVRSHGKSRWTFAKKIKYFVDIFAAFSYLPLRMSSVAGVMLALSGFIYAVFVIGFRLLGNVPVTGWASLIIIVLITAGTQLILLGITGEYLWRVLDESRNRPPFIIAESNAELGEDDPFWIKCARETSLMKKEELSEGAHRQ